MDFWIINVFLAFVFCIFFTGIVIPQILLIAFRRQLFDEPNERKIHHCEVPRLGGMAFKPVAFFSIALLLGINLAWGNREILVEMGNDARALALVFCTIMLLYLVGIADDLIGVRYRAKFAIQILCGIMLISGGVWINNLHGVLGIHEIPAWLGYPLTIFITVFIINAVNLIDGIDGLASGLCSIVFLLYGVTFFLLQRHFYSMLAFATLGVLVTFFYYNVFGNPERHKKIFMGDTGSQTIGMMLCFLGITLSGSEPIERIGNPNPLILAFIPLLVPCCDVVRVYLHRVRNNKNPFLPDKNHIHHKLLAAGMGQRTAMITVVFISLVLALCNIVLSIHVNINWLMIGDIVIWTMANVWLSNRIKSAGFAFKEIESDIQVKG